MCEIHMLIVVTCLQVHRGGRKFPSKQALRTSSLGKLFLVHLRQVSLFMADQPKTSAAGSTTTGSATAASGHAQSTAGASATPKAAEGNPAFRMMGMLRLLRHAVAYVRRLRDTDQVR